MLGTDLVVFGVLLVQAHQSMSCVGFHHTGTLLLIELLRGQARILNETMKGELSENGAEFPLFNT